VACLTAQCIADFEARKRSVVLSNGQSLAYIDTGARGGPPIVLIHGYTDSARDWLPLEPFLIEKFRVLLIDLRGHGASGKPECCYTRFDFAYDVLLLLRELHIERVDVVGHSLGSVVAQTFAEEWPEHTARLILISSTGTSFNTEGWLADVQRLQDPVDADSAFMRSWWAQSIAINPEVFSSRQRRDAAAIPARVWQAIADQSFVGVDLTSMLARIRAPTLLIWGAKDTLVSISGRQKLQEGIRGSQVRVFESLGHDLFWEDPARVAAVMADFLAAHPL
jgi:pimeloyl-ACP methyl ester carboxylesterase